VKFKNLLKRVDNLFYREGLLTNKHENLINKLRKLYNKLFAFNRSWALKIAGSAACFVLLAGTANAQSASFTQWNTGDSPIEFTDVYGSSTASLGDYAIVDGAFADMDGDGDLDAALIAYMVDNEQSELLYFENDEGVYTENADDNPFGDVSHATEIFSIDIADYDNNDTLDLITLVTASWSEVIHYELNASGAFEKVESSNINSVDYLETNSLSVKFMDVDNDNDLDIVGVIDDGTGAGTITRTYYQQEDHTLGVTVDNVPMNTALPTEVTDVNIKVADMDNDGDDDLFAFNFDDEANYCTYYENDGSGNYTVITTEADIPLPLANLNTEGITLLADLDGDNDIDVFQPGGINAVNQAAFENLIYSTPVAVNDEIHLCIEEVQAKVSIGQLTENDDSTQVLVTEIESSLYGTITDEGVSYADSISTDTVTYRIGQVYNTTDTLWSNTAEATVIPHYLGVVMVSDSTGNLTIGLTDNGAIYVDYGNGIEYIESVKISQAKDCGDYFATLNDYTAGDTIKIYSYPDYLSVDSLALNYLDISRDLSLGMFTCDNNNLTTLDASKNTNLFQLFSCVNNQLTSLILNENMGSETGIGILCSNNKLTSINVSNIAGLYALYCGNNSLTTLDVSNNTNLMGLSCENNNLTSLDVSNNTNLIGLLCANNKLNFSTLPKAELFTEGMYSYAPQAAVEAEVNNGVVDLSSHLTATDTASNSYTTTYNWYTKEGTALASTNYIENNGVFTFTATPSDSVYCTMVNAAFPHFVDDSIFSTVNLEVQKQQPVINSISAAEINEDADYTLLLTDVDASYYDESLLSLVINGGDNYSVSNGVITPDENYNGLLEVSVQLSHDDNYSEAYTFSLTVNPVNDAPELTAVATDLSVDEDNTLILSMDNVTATDVDNEATDLSLVISAGDNYTVDGLVITPAANFNGTLTVPVTVTDGTATSKTMDMSIVVNAVNDAPELTAVATDLSVDEDNTLTLSMDNVTANDVDNEDADLSLVINAGDNYTVDGFELTPAANFNGTLTVPVAVSDGTVTTATMNLSIAVNAVNDAPELTAVATDLSVDEDNTLTLSMDNVTAIDVDGDELSLIVSEGDNYTVNGLEITPAANFNGTLTVPVAVTDGTATSQTMDMSIIVNAGNGIRLSSSNNLKVYPNPASELIHIALPEGVANATIVLYNANGAKQLEMQAQSNIAHINIANLPQGIYVFKITVNNQNSILHWIKE
jgi:hypothetical protein